jgi:hypothetical protein
MSRAPWSSCQANSTLGRPDSPRAPAGARSLKGATPNARWSCQAGPLRPAVAGRRRADCPAHAVLTADASAYGGRLLPNSAPPSSAQRGAGSTSDRWRATTAARAGVALTLPPSVANFSLPVSSSSVRPGFARGRCAASPNAIQNVTQPRRRSGSTPPDRAILDSRP